MGRETRRPTAQGLPVEGRDDLRGPRQGALDPQRNVVHDCRIDHKLAVDEQFDQNRLEQGVVGRREGYGWREAQPGQQVRGAYAPAVRRRSRRSCRTKALRSRARLRRWNSAASSRSGRSASSMTSAPFETRCGTLSVGDLEGVDGPGAGRPAQIDARWLLPLPFGPVSRRIVSGQSGQHSTAHRPARSRG